MPANQKAIKTRISSVKNTKKMTKAMEMVSAAKMRKAVEAALSTRTYATLARELLEHMSLLRDPNVVLLTRRPVRNILVILISSNRGLCGSFNSNILRSVYNQFQDINNLATHRPIKEDDETIKPEGEVRISVVAIGKKSAAFAKKYGYNLVEVYDQLSEKPSLEDILPIARSAVKGFSQEAYDKVLVGFTEYKSAVEHQPKIRQLMPVTETELSKMLFDMAGRYGGEDSRHFPIESYLFEPHFDEVLDYVLPRLVESQLYQAILESSASEHSARMMAMKNASEAANDMINDLQLSYNKARQAGITQEIAEIVGGAAALE